MVGHTELEVVSVLGVSLLLAAAARAARRWLPIPETTALLLAGLAAGLAAKQWGGGEGFFALLGRGAAVTPGLIIFIFLPLLVFESAWSLDVHKFQRNLGGMLVLAVPALLLSTGVLGAGAHLVMEPLWGWGWVPCLLFGALISATDPVAVVALLKQVGAPKRLGLLIEGESLLNDGTAIVLFGLLFELLQGGEAPGVGGAIGQFAWVAGGGVLVGGGLAAAAIFWLSRTRNDLLVEVSVTLLLAYGAMILAEGLLHVSGVLAVVTAALVLKGPGRTGISPEIEETIHEVWETLAFMANSLIFFLVGIVMSSHIDAEVLGFAALGAVAALFLAVVAARFGLVFALRPLLRLVAAPISVGEATAISWGGLRGAVSLALALVVAQTESLEGRFGDELLVVTAGVVLLTILVNGGLMRRLLASLGFTEAPIEQQLQEAGARRVVIERVEARIDAQLARDEAQRVRWTSVRSQLEGAQAEAEEAVDEARARLAEASPEARRLAAWSRALAVERRCYWGMFSSGTLSAGATRRLDAAAHAEMDALRRGQEAPAFEARDELLPRWRQALLRRLGWGRGVWAFEHLVLRYELCRAASRASRQTLDDLEGLGLVDLIDDGDIAAIREGYEGYRARNLERLEDLRANLPELTAAVENRLARRIALSWERAELVRLRDEGLIDADSASPALASIEERIAVLERSAQAVELPPLKDLITSISLFAKLDDKALERLGELVEEVIVSPGEELVVEGEEGDSLLVIARGAVSVVRGRGEEEELLAVIGGGEVIGEMALLTGEPRSATARALTTVTAGRLSRRDFEEVARGHDEIVAGLRERFAERLFENVTRGMSELQEVTAEQRQRWFQKGRSDQLHEGGTLSAAEGERVFVVRGRLEGGGEALEGPKMWGGEAGLAAQGEVWLWRLPPLAELFAAPAAGRQPGAPA